MKVLITGGSGFLGVNLSSYLLDRNYKVRILDISEPDECLKEKVEFVKGDVRDYEIVRKCVKGMDFVVHSAAALPLYSIKDIVSTNVEGTFNVLKASFEEGVKRVIFISSTSVYGIPKKHPIVEEDDLDGVGPYGKSKIEAEKICLDFRKRGLCVPIIRPKTFVGPKRLGVFAIYFEWIKEGRNVPIIGNGRNLYQLLDVEDLCEAIHLCMTRPCEKVNRTFNIGAEKFGTMKEDFGFLLNLKGRGKIIPLPVFPTVWILKILHLLRLSPLYPWVYETAHRESYVSIEKAKKYLGFHPKYSNKETLLRSYKWYLKECKKLKKGISHRSAWKEGILKLVKIVLG